MKRAIFTTGLLLLLHTILLAQDNPFLSSDKPVEETEKKQIQYPGFVQNFIRIISSVQHKLNDKISTLALTIKEEKSKKPIFIIMVITFIYGMLHALGPGHGKTVTFSYFLSQRAEIRKGIVVGSIIGLLHALSAITIVLILYFIIKQSFLSTSIEDLRRIIKLISYGIIIVIGLFLVIKSIIDLKKNSHSEENDIQQMGNNRSIIPFALAIGITPCTGAVIVLLFAISMDIIAIGIISTLIMGLGMTTTISLVGVSTILTKKGIVKLVASTGKVNVFFHHASSIVGSMLLLLLGILLFIGTI